MRAEERHELRETEMSSLLHYGIVGWLRQNGSYVLLAAALAFLGYQLWNRHKQNQENERQTAQAEFESAKSRENEMFLPEDKDGTKSYKALDLLPNQLDNCKFDDVKAEIALELGRLYGLDVASSYNLRTIRKVTHAEALNKAYEYYTQALSLRGNDPLVAARAHKGLAAVYEDQGDWDKAKEEYAAIIKASSASPAMSAYAKAALDSLEERRSAPRLSNWSPPVAVNPTPSTPGFNIPGLPGGGMMMNPASPGSFLLPGGGLNLGTPTGTPTTSSSGTPSTSPFNLSISPIGPSPTPSSNPATPELPK